MGLASKLQKPAGGPAGAPPGAPGGFTPSAPPAAPQQQQQYGAPPSSGGPTQAYPAPGYGAQPGQHGGMQGANMQGNQSGYGQPGGQFGQQGSQFGQQGGQSGQQGGQFGQQGGQFGQQGNQFGQQNGQFGQQGNQQGGQFGQQGGQQGGQFGQQGGQYGQQGQAQGQNQGQNQGILAKLQSIVQVNQLHRFYQPQQLQTLAQRIEQTVDFNALAARWGMPKELAIDLACLGLYDIVILADDSSSMSFEEQGERIEDLKLVLSKVAEVATMFDQDGILIRFLNSNVQGNGIRNAQEAEGIVKQVRFQGLTPLAGSMQSHVLEPVVFNLARSGQLAKPVLVITITDGEPSDSPRDAILQVIANARRQLAPQYGPKAVAFQFAQVGRDQRAQHFLEKLDKSPEVGDVIDCTSYYELEAEEFKRKGIDMTVEIWLVKLMVGAVDPSYDAEDEG
ncbi:hypothetical protein KFL_003840050 [Klebsormidium nitens]|uniref:VWFA domain-containing protein n=1 Tax=Klebsormidium nitens TaxID=105231 RepID=A0A1Y1IBD7_KLENI|nr:hypothetical protein KFL_003840050 [Klebsormidium nitens]|eukprot:GAQ87873.1 hypothetical protein KFL_003840050 [Klebsormidium nitens]